MRSHEHLALFSNANYGCDVSGRYIETRTREVAGAGVGDSRPPSGSSDARLRAPEGARHETRHDPRGDQLWHPLSHAQASVPGRLDNRVGRGLSDYPPDDHQAGPGCLQDHRRGQGTVRRSSGPCRPGNVRRRRFRGAFRLLLPDRPRDPPADSRGSAPPHRGTPRGPARSAVARHRPPRRVHPGTSAPRPRGRRARGPLAGGAHHQRALRPHPVGPGRRPRSPRRPGWGRIPRNPASAPGPAVMNKEANAMGSVRVAIVGVGNCASSLVQGVEYYKNADPNDRVPGLMHVTFGDYHVSDVKFGAAFDVDAKKVGMDLAEAIVASENNTIKLTDVPPTGVTVQRGPTFDGLGTYYREIIEESSVEAVDVVQALRDAEVDVVVSYLPVGSEQADKFYAQAAIDAGCAFVNALPVFIASDPVWAQKFTDAGLPIVGDDIKSQVGATIVHRALAKLFEDRGVELLRTYQLNFGGNMDFMNMLERTRLVSKKISKTQSVTSQIPHEMVKSDVHIGPSDYVPWLDDRKWAYIRLEGRAFGDVPLNAELKLEVWDSPNSAGIIIDAIRAAKIAMDRGIGGPLLSASSYFMKSPPEQYADDDARDAVDNFINGEVDR